MNVVEINGVSKIFGNIDSFNNILHVGWLQDIPRYHTHVWQRAKFSANY